MGWYYPGGGWGGWIAMSLTMLAFWVLVVAAIVAIFRGTGERRSGPDSADPLRILEERFARGEIDADEYAARKAVLQGRRRPDLGGGR